MKVTEDMHADRDWLVRTHSLTASAGIAEKREAWRDLEESGWATVFARISGTWTQFDDNGRPCNRMPFRSQAALLHTVGVFKADQVLAALDLWIASPDGVRQPSPAELYHSIAQPTAGSGVNQPPRLRPDQQPHVLSFVVSLLDGGESVCECRPAPMQFVIDAHGVLWCPDCAGIEVGQADQAREFADPVSEADVAFADLGAVVRLRRVRERRAARQLEERKVGA